MADVKTFTSQNWQNEVLDADKPVLVDFWASWCGPCRMIGPVVEELAGDYDGKVIVGKLNVDEQGEIAQKYGIMSIPSLLLFKNGQIKEKTVGFRGKGDLVKIIDSSL
ncbi:thioredoxin [Syntrophobotulus glycolicus DSM 8271]|uniref:Thioredoxin n=1 Tax=Syntrophobotulus glycolicus (strain DSM 8271 / FlGlyR) TaxID=645991 RepID=F0T247_SYNGF|nr:thioredoxin [Syntrophobotulus glycolicus]ADY56391.1 thioredoxin [Syntrophobotulus glycolicus DSM 8271]